MSTPITADVYSQIAQAYGDGMDQLDGVDQHFYDAVYEVLVYPSFDVENALLNPFYNAYLTSITSFDAPPAIVSAVASLQRHILAKATDDSGDKYTDINDWLDDNSVTVSQSFADLSELAGFLIDDDNIGIVQTTPALVISVVSVDGGDNAIWTFDQTIVLASTDASELTISSGDGGAIISQPTASSIKVGIYSGGALASDPWVIAAQPPGITTIITTPQSGIVS